ncbi:MAG: tetratricopeptide repeat protein [Rubripirellula sp.]|nr:tetratricopeptide repeat protein [Rubripirellula sp.]
MVSLLVLLYGSTVSAQEDQVFIKRGPSVKGNVGQVSPIQIAVNVRGVNRVIKTNEVRSVAFSDEPLELSKGRARAIVGKYESAIGDLKSVDPQAISRDLIKQDLQFYFALCEGRLALSSGGDKPKATELMLAFVRSAADSFHFFEAAELLGDLAVSQGDYENAVKYYGAIASKAPWPEYQMRALLSEARAMVQQGNFAEARKKFENVIAKKSDTPEAKRQKLLADVGRGRCLAETASTEEGIATLEKIIDENDSADSQLFGRAYNALGDCLQVAGKPNEALMAYLHVDVLFYADPEIHAESLYHLSKLWQVLKKPDRAAAAKNLLNQRYAGSVWSGKP